jgi:hypothetical protein
MSYLYDTNPQGLAGAYHFGGPGLGVLGSVIRATTASGTHGPGYLYNDWDGSGDDAKAFQGLVITPPSAGVFVAWEDGSFALTGAPDGSYSFTYRLYLDGADQGTATASITLGVANATASGSVAAVQLTAPSASAEATGPTYHRPSSDISAGGWTATPGGSLASCIDEAAADDADYITSPDTSTPAVLALSPAMTAGDRTIRVRAARTGSTGQLRVRLLDGSNVDVGGTAWQALTAIPTTYTLAATLTATADRYRIEVQP